MSLIEKPGVCTANKKNDKTTGHYRNKCPRLTSHIRLYSHHIASQLIWKSWNHLTPFFLEILNFIPRRARMFVCNKFALTHEHMTFYCLFTTSKIHFWYSSHVRWFEPTYVPLHWHINEIKTKSGRKKTNFRYFTSTFFGCRNSKWII